MLIRIDENSAALSPFGSLAFGSLARHIPAETKSWSELLRSVLFQTRQKRSDEIATKPQVQGIVEGNPNQAQSQTEK